MIPLNMVTGPKDNPGIGVKRVSTAKAPDTTPLKADPASTAVARNKKRWPPRSPSGGKPSHHPAAAITPCAPRELHAAAPRAANPAARRPPPLPHRQRCQPSRVPAYRRGNTKPVPPRSPPWQWATLHPRSRQRLPPKPSGCEERPAGGDPLPPPPACWIDRLAAPTPLECKPY